MGVICAVDIHLEYAEHPLNSMVPVEVYNLQSWMPRQITLMVDNMFKFLFTFAIFLFGSSVYSAPPSAEPVDVFITNDGNTAIPIEILNKPTVVCYLSLGTIVFSTAPFADFSSSTSTTRVMCPDGVEKIQVRRIGFSPDVSNGPGAASSNIASFRVSVGFQNAASSFPPQLSNILAILSNSAPVADVTQDFLLDTTNSSEVVYFVGSSSSVASDFPIQFGGTAFFIGTPIP